MLSSFLSSTSLNNRSHHTKAEPACRSSNVRVDGASLNGWKKRQEMGIALMESCTWTLTARTKKKKMEKKKKKTQNNLKPRKGQKAWDTYGSTYISWAQGGRGSETLKQLFSRVPIQREQNFGIWKKENACYYTIPSVSHETKPVIHFFTETRPELKCATLSQIFFSEQIAKTHDLRTAIATDSAMHSVQDKRGGNDRQWVILRPARSEL